MNVSQRKVLMVFVGKMFFLEGGWIWLFCNTPTLNEANLSLFVNFFPFCLIRVFSINHRFLHFKLDGELSCDLPKEDKKFNETSLLFLLVLCHTLLSKLKIDRFLLRVGGTRLPFDLLWLQGQGQVFFILISDKLPITEYIFTFVKLLRIIYFLNYLFVRWHRENSE